MIATLAGFRLILNAECADSRTSAGLAPAEFVNAER